MGRSQTSTEYLVITAVVIAIAVIIISVLGGIPTIGSGASARANEAELRTAEVATEGFLVSNVDLHEY